MPPAWWKPEASCCGRQVDLKSSEMTRAPGMGDLSEHTGHFCSPLIAVLATWSIRSKNALMLTTTPPFPHHGKGHQAGKEMLGFERIVQVASTAPAGFGKTTLLAEFLAACGVPAVWLSLDAEDNDPQRFLSALLAALQTRDPSLGASVQALLSAPHGLQGLSLSAVFTLLINDLASRESGEFLLVLDDYHTITLAPIQHAIAQLVERCPPNLHLVMSMLRDPP